MEQTDHRDFDSARSVAPRIESETLALLRSFLGPIIERAQSWSELRDMLAARGYGLAFREGRMVILADAGTVVCTGRCLGAPLRALSARLGRPAIRAGRDGRSGTLH